MLKKYIGENVRVTFMHTFEKVTFPDGIFTTKVVTEETTLEGKVFLYEGKGLLLQADGVVTEFTNPELKLHVEVVR